MNRFFQRLFAAVDGTTARASAVRSEFANIETAFDEVAAEIDAMPSTYLPGSFGAPLSALRVNAAGTGVEWSPVEAPLPVLDVQTGVAGRNAISARFNMANTPIAFGVANSNGFPYIGLNTRQVSGTDGQTYDIAAAATRLRMDGGAFVFNNAGAGAAGAAIAWAERLRIDASGHLTPGADNTQTLGSAARRWNDVHATTFRDGANGTFLASSGTLALFGSGSAWTQALFYTGGTERMRIDASGNAAIGATTSTARLRVNGAGSGTTAIAVTDQTLTSNEVFLGMDPTNSVGWAGSSVFPFAIRVNGAERLRVDGSGNVGVGNNSPSTSLTASTRGIAGLGDGNGFQIRLQSSVSGATANDGLLLSIASNNDGYLYNYEAANLIFGTSNAERMKIDPNGRVIIGSGGVNADLEIARAAASNAEFVLRGNGSAYAAGFSIQMNADTNAYLFQRSNSAMVFGTNNTERLRIGANGRVGIGLAGAAPTSMLQIAGLQELVRLQDDSAYIAFANSANSVRTGYLQMNTVGASVWMNEGPRDLAFGTNSIARMFITAAGVIQDGAGRELGWKNIPRTTSSPAYGQMFAATAGFTLNGGDIVGATYSVYNDSASAITITQGGGLTLRLAGTTTTGNRTLAARGLATIWFNTANEAVISGPGVT